LILTPPELGSQLVQKFEALEAIVWDGAYNGWPADNRHLLMLTAVKADLYRFLNRKPWQQVGSYKRIPFILKHSLRA